MRKPDEVAVKTSLVLSIKCSSYDRDYMHNLLDRKQYRRDLLKLILPPIRFKCRREHTYEGKRTRELATRLSDQRGSRRIAEKDIQGETI